MQVDNEEQRLTELHSYRILDTPRDGMFDNICEIASYIFKTPIAIVSLVDRDRIWFKSTHGINIKQIDREPGLCASAIIKNEAYVIKDARIDPRTLTNSLVSEKFGLQFYAAAPLTTSNNLNLGTICVIDFKPREVTTEEINCLSQLAQIVINQMELRIANRKISKLHKELFMAHTLLKNNASKDALTGILNRGSLDQILEKIDSIEDSITGTAIAMIDIDDFKNINDIYGHHVGDEVIKAVSNRITKVIRNGDYFGRYGGEEFQVIMQQADSDSAKLLANRIVKVISAKPYIIDDLSLAVTVSVGVSVCNELTVHSTDELSILADKALYDAKKAGKNCAKKYKLAL
ncbi:MAG: diguanylate cyclase (GGDEF)-like protein [Motiliproteus sp.]|jgi:diguanylate cyclase (GGDEF)-like protein